jgi:1-deoxy-D-xylulose-5-phosphate synthase
MLLKLIKSPEDIKELEIERLYLLAEELRSVIIEHVSKNGGHLSSNLGVIELAIAIHYVFDSPNDKIVWDVGHQCYAHKLLTGRYPLFHTLRKYGGISGFPRISESPHDAFGTGHSSTSISAATGILEARDILKKIETNDSKISQKVVAIIGDGALTSGLAFEGLNYAGHLKKDLIVILNDNEMSISKNVGALSSYLSKILAGEFYRILKRETKAIIEGIPKIGEVFSKIAQKAEGSMKGFFLPGGLFEDLGFNYIGPIDGHNLSLLIDTLKGAKKGDEPILIHIVTKKGKGYKLSEDNPSIYHGVGPFDQEKGIGVGDLSYSELFGRTLTEIAESNKRIVAITAAMKEGTGLSTFASRHPERFYDVGIAESHAVTFAAGLASQGLIPVVAIYSTFFQRAYDQIIHDVCLQNLPVVFAIDRAGIVGEDGATHQGIFDISYLRHIPNITVMAPKDGNELRSMLNFAIKLRMPVAIRYPREKVQNIIDCTDIRYGKAEILLEGSDILILAIGSTVGPSLKAAERLKKKGINASVVNARFIKPLDKELILSLAKRIKKIVTVEENVLVGGFGSAVLELFNENNLNDIILKRIGIDDTFVEHGSQAFLRNKFGIDEDGIYKGVLLFLDEKETG